MKNLLKKEILLCMHPTAPMFILLSAMLLIPNYPYYVVFFYTGLAVFLTCLNGRENQDVTYTLMLPVAKQDIVKGRFLFVILLELLQVSAAVPFAILRQKMPMPGNQAGMDANIALFGFAFILLGAFNLVFFLSYYKNVSKVGKSFAWASVVVFAYIGIMEGGVHIVPYMRDCLDTPDPQYLSGKLIVLAVGILIYAVFTGFAYRRSVTAFLRQDL